MNSDTDRQIRDKTWGEGLLESQTDRKTDRALRKKGWQTGTSTWDYQHSPPICHHHENDPLKMISLSSENEKSFYCVLFPRWSPRENQSAGPAAFWKDCWTSCSEEYSDEKSFIEFDIPAPQPADGSDWSVLLSLPEETRSRSGPVPKVPVIWEVRQLRWSLCKPWQAGAGEIRYSVDFLINWLSAHSPPNQWYFKHYRPTGSSEPSRPGLRTLWTSRNPSGSRQLQELLPSEPPQLPWELLRPPHSRQLPG